MTTAQTAACLCTAALTVLLPLGGMLLLRKRGGSWKAFGVGAAVFFLFAMVAEQLFHTLVLLSPLGKPLQANLWATALYGGLAAGLFEETGRLVAFKTVLRREEKPVTALGYGLGHGGCEAILVVGVTMVLNVAVTSMANGSALPEAVQLVAETAKATPASHFLWAGAERISAMALHMANSVLVFTAVRRGRLRLYWTAVSLHAAMDVFAVAANALLPVAATELILAAFAAGTVLLAAKLCQHAATPSQT